MKFPRYFCIIAAFVALSALHAGAQAVTPQPTPIPSNPQPKPERITKMPVVALPIRDFKLLTSGTGWVSTGNRLLFTIDNGAHWKDISPPVPNQDRLASVFFHDADTGWVLFSHRVQDSERPEPVADEPSSDWSFAFSFTVNGGATWTTANLPAWQGDRGLADQGIIAFADKQHGWLSLDIEGNTLFGSSYMMLTSDGGRTWHDTTDCSNGVNDGPEGRIKGILALTDKDTWVVGTLEGGSVLYVTHDGGSCFHQVSISAPKEIASAGGSIYGLPIFEDNLNGYEEVTYTGGSGDTSAVVLYATTDGGHTWRSDRILANLAPEASPASSKFSTVASSTWIHSFATKGTKPMLKKLPPNSGTTNGAYLSLNSYNCDLSFLTKDEGWMNCAGELSSTIDGGASWTSIAPRVHNGALTQDPVTPVKSVPGQLKTIPLASPVKT